MANPESLTTKTAIATVAREIEEFVASGGWNQTPQLFALVSTEALLREQPELASQLDKTQPLTPVAQDSLPNGDLAQALGTLTWPESVAGCALAQEIIILPPTAEEALLEESSADADRLRQAAANHPQRTEARLVAAVLRDGSAACLMRLRSAKNSSENEVGDELIERPDLAPNLIEALKATLNL